MTEQITISEFRARHNLSSLKFSRLRIKAERLNPGVKIASYYHEERHNHNILLRADLLEALLPPLKRTEAEVNLNDLYARISRLEAEASMPKSRKRPIAKQKSELSRAFEGEV